ncbi:MAG: hypothetical protein ICV51_19920 [Flavisolibacter sp.]|nr:hypothetical protein [Flavisolibacter sp.]
MKSLHIKWVINCSIGELIGIGLAGSIAVAVNHWLGEPQSFLQKSFVLIIMLFAGALEGTSIAWFQWQVLHHLFPRMKFISWWRWTVLIALLGWAAGTTPSLFLSGSEPSSGSEPGFFLIAIVAVVGGGIAGALFGLFQSFVLKKHTGKWPWWIIANTIAWSVAMLIIFAGATWPSAVTPVPVIVLSAIISGCLAGLSLGVVTGLFLFHKIVNTKEV